MHLRTYITFSFQDYYFNLDSNNLLFMATVPLWICLCASGATGHLVYMKGRHLVSWKQWLAASGFPHPSASPVPPLSPSPQEHVKIICTARITW
jgi:hypothetical protein